MKSLALRRPSKVGPPRASLTPISGSLPIAMAKPKPLPSLSSVFGRKNEIVSKSWSDLWDEDIEEEEEEAEQQLKARQMANARTWSHESKEDDTVRAAFAQTNELSNIPKLSTETGRTALNDIDGDIVADGFFFHDTPKAQPAVPQYSPRYSPPSKRTTFDKWIALGERRRAYTGSSESEKSPELWKTDGKVGLGFAGFGAGVWDSKANTVIKDKGKECPWNRVRDHHDLRKSRAVVDQGDLEWVGGYQPLHL